jgi:acetoacetyl-CoA synthetase
VADARPVSGADGELVWEPSEDRRARSNIACYMEWLRATRGLRFSSYAELWEWSVSDLEGFWGSLWERFEVLSHSPPTRVLAGRSMPGAAWFPGAELNYAEHALRRRDDHTALLFRTEDGRRASKSYAELGREVAALAAFLRRRGVRRGDRVVAYMPNIPETVTALLATAAIGAVWSSCPPELGAPSVIDRFRQLEPRVLFAVDGYRYNGRPFDRVDAVAEIRGQLPSVDTTVLVPYLAQEPAAGSLTGAILWPDLPSAGVPPAFEAVPFDHPLWVLYSSGTTGLPKGIVQGHGGILLEHLKSLSLHLDLTARDRFLWFTTTGWVMWNRLVGGLLLGMTIVLYDGSPAHPDLGALWRLAGDEAVTYLGVGAPYLVSLMKADIEPGRDFDLSALRSLGSTGAPLPPEAFAWVWRHVKADLLLGSLAGGTDVCTALVGSCPLLPVHAGEIQCRSLGARVEAYDERGHPLIGATGELVVTEPMPSMPLYLWGDGDGSRYRESYFAVYPGVWRHGDWIRITPRGSCVIHGRSDSTLNRGGIRMGTSEFYRVVEDLPEVADSLVVHLDGAAEGRLMLFVVVREGAVLDGDLRARIRERIRQDLSPRHVPDEIRAVPEVPRTLNGKKLEVPVRRILMGTPAEQAVSPGAMSNPRSLRPFLDLALELREGPD